MRLPHKRRRKPVPIDTDEARRELARAQDLEQRARQVVAREKRLKERNNFGPKIGAALREAHR